MSTDQFSRLSRHPDITVTEEIGWWIKGRISDACFELSFEDYAKFLPYAERLFPHPKVPLTYLGVHTVKYTESEFQLGKWSHIPRSDDAKHRLSTLLSLLVGVRPGFYHTPWTPSIPYDVRTYLGARKGKT